MGKMGGVKMRGRLREDVLSRLRLGGCELLLLLVVVVVVRKMMVVRTTTKKAVGCYPRL